MKIISPDTLYYRASGKLPEEVFSFLPLYEFLRRQKEERTIARKLYASLLREIDQRPELKGAVKPELLRQDSQVLEMIHAITTNIIHATEDDLWALALPASIGPFYGTDGIASLIVNKKDNVCDLAEQEEESHDSRRIAFMYSTILEKVYKYRSKLSGCLVLEIRKKEPIADQYYEVNIDTTFLNVAAKGELPAIDLNKLESSADEDAVAYLTEALPLDIFRFEGFVVLTLKDVTEQHALSAIRNSILSLDDDSREVCERQIKSALHTLAGSTALDFGLMPLIMLNDKPVVDFGELTRTLVSSQLSREDMILEEEVQRFLHHPELRFIPDVSANPLDESTRFLRSVLMQANISSFALVPLFYNKQLVGAIEVVSKEPGVLTEDAMRKLGQAFPLLSQLLKYAVEAIQNRISLVISEKFTAVQASVAWKFREAAWAYLIRQPSAKQQAEPDAVRFNHLYPLYGAIDIRNSSVERNRALKLDLAFQLGLLADTLALLKKELRLSILDEVSFRIEKWMQVQENNSTEEHKISHYLETEVVPFLRHVRSQHPGSQQAIDAYLEVTEPVQGLAYRHRRELERSMQMVTQAISLYLDLMNMEMQKAYPCYFEKFRTDGIEYDIYIGQSLRPDFPFDMMYLRNLRFMQLSSMAGIYKQLHGLLPQMPYKLRTTQLIYVNPEPIDISFRMDEKRFDVEGGYNIRYQVIKKRIDKVRVRDTGERLTQPGTIAIVYSSNADVREYVSYIDYLRENKILAGDIEYLDLEELQGVDGLKALRIGINVEDQHTGNEQ